MGRKMTLAEKYAMMPPEQISKMGGPEGRKQLEKILRTMRSGYSRRVSAFKRNDIVSYAQIAFEGAGGASKKPIKKMSFNQIVHEISKYSSFFTSETSNVAGVKRVNREQDKRIFGEDARGRPVRTMTNEERDRYWSLYDEFKKQKKAEFYSSTSETVQQQLAEMSVDKFPSLQEMFDEMSKKLAEARDIASIEEWSDVYSGGGPFIK